MEYAKVKANSTAEAMMKVRQTYGPDAILLEEKWIEPGTFFGKLMGKKSYQITVALRQKEKPVSARSISNKIDTLETMSRIETRNQTNTPYKAQTKPSDEALHFLREIGKHELLSQTTNERKEKRATATANSGLDRIADDLEFIKKNLVTRSVPLQPSEKDFFSLKSALLSQGFSGEFTEEFLSEMRTNLPQGDFRNREKVYQQALSAMTRRVRVNPGIGNRQVISFIGPTGVGKTTTIAKVAADLALRQQRKIELITLDNFRIAATEQLKVYANIMGVPIGICRTPKELREYVVNSTAEVILVDNTGVGPSNTKFIQEQKEFFDAIPEKAEKHLVLAATSKKEDAEDILQKFDQIGYERIILTKLDETSTCGAFIELAEKANRSFSFFTVGQEVPEDIRNAEGGFLAEKVLSRWYENAAKD